MISIIGGGPAGNYLASLLARQGKQVCVYEEHNKIGEPVQCAGIVTSDLAKFVNIDKKFLINTVDKIRIFLRDKKLEFRIKPNYILDRAKFDVYLAEKAMEYGAEYKLGWKFLGFENNKLKFNHGLRETDILIGADGPFSTVAKKTGLYGDREFFIAEQIVCRKKVDKTVVEGHFDKGYFGWVVPESGNRVRVGVGVRSNVLGHFNKFLDRINVRHNHNFQSGLIPIYNPKAKICRGNVYLLGDAALQVKPTSGGGILQGLAAAQELYKSILYGYDYERLCKQRFGLDLYVSLLARKRLDKFTEKDFDYLYNLADKQKIKSILSVIDRDYAGRILFKVLLREPRFLKLLFE